MKNYCITVPEYGFTTYSLGRHHMDALEYAIEQGSLYIPSDYPTKVVITDQNNGVSIFLDMLQS